MNAEKRFLETLSESQKELYEEGRDCENIADNAANELAFARGFRLGVRLLLEALREA